MNNKKIANHDTTILLKKNYVFKKLLEKRLKFFYKIKEI